MALAERRIKDAGDNLNQPFKKLELEKRKAKYKMEKYNSIR